MSDETAEARLLDLRGLRCPWPALRVARALRDGDRAVIAVADDPRAGTEIAAVAAARGWSARRADTPLGPGIRLQSNRTDFRRESSAL